MRGRGFKKAMEAVKEEEEEEEEEGKHKPWRLKTADCSTLRC